MDSLLSKMGPLKALVPVRKTVTCEGNDSSQMQSRSLQVCVCRSPSAQSKAGSTVASNAPIIQETSSDTILNPLPLPSSRTAVPPPLRFLWFNRRSSGNNGNESVLEQGYPSNADKGEASCTPLCAEKNEDAASSLLLSTQNIGESMFPPVVVSKDMAQKQMDASYDLDDIHESASMQEKQPNSLGQAAIAADMLSDAIMASTDSSMKKSWISKLVDFTALWPIRKSSSASADISKLSSLPVKEEPTNASNCEGSFAGCEFDECEGCSLEVPYTKVLHNKDTFSKYLQDASLFDMKLLAQMSFLCDMAYMIPDIQPGQLLKHHHLKFITSSLERKAEAEAEAKAKNSVPQKGAPTETLSEKCVLELDSLNFSTEVNIPQTMGGSQTHAGGARNLDNGSTEIKDQREEDEIECVGHKTHLPTIKEEFECIDEESLMAVAPATVVVLAEESSKLAVTKDLQTSSSCPCEWFICDDESSYTRLFVIQGSESMASWQANLFFEPMKFEELDVLVHRGIYEAANALYEQVLPEVLAHFSAHGELTQVRLTGHSLGGSLATLLALMFQIRGVLPRKCILPVVTFGSPCIMCGGDKLLLRMNLPANHIRSIIMHRDVVPRAFSCDYPDRVAQILKRLNGKFRDHPCLNNQKLLYAPMGQLMILQPDENTAPSHPFLPCGYGLYLLRHPTNEGGVERATELRAAQRAFLNMPHPLEILSDPGAYGLNGAVSRDHNPRSYTKAIHVVLRHEVKRLRRVQREQRRQFWWPLVIAESSWFAQRGPNLSSSVDHSSTKGAFTTAVCKISLFSGHTMSHSKNSSPNRIGSALGSFSLWQAQKAAISRYARLIASKHVQMGMLVIVSLRVVIVECLQSIYVWI